MSLRTPATALLLAACTLRPYEFGASATDSTTTTTGDTTTTTTTTAPTTLPIPTSSTSTTLATSPDITATAPTTTDDLSTTSSAGNDFIVPPDFGGQNFWCDQWTQNCPEGQKCMPYSGDGDISWESLKCVPVVPNPDGLYEPCTAGPISTGEDTCDKGLMCWTVTPDVDQCVGMCIGNEAEPDCADPTASCTIAAGGVLTICIPSCDPLAQDCFGGDLCIPNPMTPEKFICVLDASADEGQVFEPCEYANGCDPGLMCQDPAMANECDPMALGCCLPFCDTTLPNTCPGQAQECLPWYEPGMAPPGDENIGLCGLPMP